MNIGLRLPVSIRLIAVRSSPVSLASFSWEICLAFLCSWRILPKISSFSVVTREIVAGKRGCVYRRQLSTKFIPPAANNFTGALVNHIRHPRARRDTLPGHPRLKPICLDTLLRWPGEISPVTRISAIPGSGKRLFSIRKREKCDILSDLKDPAP